MRRKREQTVEELRNIQNRTSAFIDVLTRHKDAPITESDVKEYYPDIEWTGSIAATWHLLHSDESVAPHLRSYGDGKTRVYAFLSNPENEELLKQRLLAIATELEQPSDMFQAISHESLEVDEKSITRWWKIAAIAGVAASAMTVTGAAIYHKIHKSR